MVEQSLLGTIGVNMPLLLAAEGYALVSWWKPLILLVPIVVWAFIVSTVYDKHAARFHLAREQWNIMHLCVGLSAIVVPLLIPLGAWWGVLVALVTQLAILSISIVSYPLIANKDERVPERHRVKFSLAEAFAASRQKSAAKKRDAQTSELEIVDSNKTRLPPPEKETPEFELRVASERVVLRAKELRASQVDLIPAKDGSYVPSFLVDGVRQNGEAMAPAQAVPIIDFWKRVGGMDPQERRKRQSGSFKVRAGSDTTDVYATSSGTQGGLRLTMLFDPAKAVRRPIEDLGLMEPQLDAVKGLLAEEGGVVLLAAGPDQGSTTTLYAITKMHDAYTSNVQTVEVERAESMLEGVRQNVIDPLNPDQDFAKTVRSILRRDPDVVSIATVPDAETAREAASGDLARTRVYVSLRTDSALSAIQLWVKSVGDPEKAAAHLKGVIAQRLVRRLCVNCRQPYQPSPDILKKLGLPADRVKQLYKKGGQVLIKNKPEVCPVCNGVGYIGQAGVFEVFPIGEAERALVRAGDLNGLKAELRKRQLPTIQQSALRLAVEGVTSIEEVSRVTLPPASSSSGSGSRAARPSGAAAPEQPKPTAPAS